MFSLYVCRIYAVASGYLRVLSNDSNVLGYSIPAGVINITCHEVMYTTHTVIYDSAYNNTTKTK